MALTYFPGAGLLVAPLDAASATLPQGFFPVKDAAGSILLDKPLLGGTAEDALQPYESALALWSSGIHLVAYQTMAASYKVESGKAATGGGYEGPRVFPPPYALKP